MSHEHSTIPPRDPDATMASNQALRWMYIKTGLASATVALVVGLSVDFQWGAAFAIASVFGLANWYFLGRALLALTARPARAGEGLLFLFGKIVLLFVYAGLVLPQTGLVLSAFLGGFMMFLLIALSEALGALLANHLKSRPAGRPLPEDLKSLFNGSRPRG